MNAVEIEEAISVLAGQPFDPEEFPFAFLESFGRNATEIKRLRDGASNKSDLGGVLQRNNIHIKVCPRGEVEATIQALRNSPATAKSKAKFILATDGENFQAEDLISDAPPVICEYSKFPECFGFFLPLAGISTVRQIRENAFDIKATGRLNRLYVELLKSNPEWDTIEGRQDMNHFIVCLIFCFFAEDTDIFSGTQQFTSTIEQMSEPSGSNTHEIISELFRSINTSTENRDDEGIARWTREFPYVNGGLFSTSVKVPRFSKIARSYLLNIGNLDWKKINPDIFGSMIQALAEGNERAALGMHYTSVPNILKVLNPLLLDGLRAKLIEAGDNPKKLLNLRRRMAKIRVFDPACGSGNFLVIAYKEMRAIEAEINSRRKESDRRSDIPLTNFRGIEVRDFPADIARLALIISEFQCDVLYRGQREALRDFLPLGEENWITCDNALQADWIGICPPEGTDVKMHHANLLSKTLSQAQVGFENQGGETYICGNPPYLGQTLQDAQQKKDLAEVFKNYKSKSAAVDYVSAWFVKAAEYNKHSPAPYAFVTTNSIWQGQQVSVLWPILKQLGADIIFAHPSFKWKNLARHNAGVTVSIVGIEHHSQRPRILFESADSGEVSARQVQSINAYLVQGRDIIVHPEQEPINGLAPMLWGNQPRDDRHFSLQFEDLQWCKNNYPSQVNWFKKYVGSAEMIHGKQRGCIWITDEDAEKAKKHPFVGARLEAVRKIREASKAPSTQSFANRPHRFVQIQGVAERCTIAVAGVSSEHRKFIPVDLLDEDTIISNLLFGIYDGPIWNFAIISSSLHTVWTTTVCGKLGTGYRYSNTLGWNTFPVPEFTEKNKTDLARCAENILLMREAHFPATIADLYDPDKMPEDLHAAHEFNDETLERIYIGRKFKNNTERLEKLFSLYDTLTSGRDLT